MLVLVVLGLSFGDRLGFSRVASPPVVSELVAALSVVGSLLLVEASETATAGPQGP
jgi:hypothetical protein